MDCKECRYFYTESFNHNFNYCREVDKYVFGNNFKCPVKKSLSKVEKIKLKISVFLTGESKLNS